MPSLTALGHDRPANPEVRAPVGDAAPKAPEPPPPTGDMCWWSGA